jgi:hypothetical protein
MVSQDIVLIALLVLPNLMHALHTVEQHVITLVNLDQQSVELMDIPTKVLVK